MRQNFICITMLLFLYSFNLHAVGSVYGSFTTGLFRYGGSDKFSQLDKYEGSLGFEWNSLNFLTLALEVRYAQGVGTFQAYPKLSLSPQMVGGFNKNGVSFVPVRYGELWLRPKLRLPLPWVKPYLAFPLSPLGYGGLVGHGSYTVGIGALAGVDVEIFALRIFLDSGIIARMQKAKKDIDTGPPYGSFDFSIPVSVGLGYTF